MFRAALLVLSVAVLTGACRADEVASTDARVREVHALLLAGLDTRASRFETLARAFPHEGVWASVAASTRGAVTRLRSAPVRIGDLSTWWSSAAASGRPVAAWRSGELWLDRGAFALGVLFRPTARERASYEGQLVDLESYLLHEAVHMAQGTEEKLNVLDPGESEAWTAQYTYLVACGMDRRSPALDNAVLQLVKLGALTSASATGVLDSRLGLDVARAHLVAAPASPASTAVDDAAARGRRLCAAYAEMTRREVAKRNQEAPGQYQLRILAPFTYVRDANGDCCSCAFEMLKKVEGTGNYSAVFQRGSAASPDRVPLSQVESWLKRARADPYYGDITW